MSRIKYFLLGLMLIAMAGCSTAKKENAEQKPAAAQESAAPPEPVLPPEAQEPAAVAEQQQAAKKAAPRIAAQPRPKPAIASRESARAPKQIPAPQAPQPSAAESYETAPAVPAQQVSEEPVPLKAAEPRYATIPSGANIEIRLQDPLDSAVNKAGDAFRGILDKDIEVDGMVVAPRGSSVEGKLTSAARSGRVEGRAAMSLELVELNVNQQSYPLQTEVLSFEAESTKKSDATKVGIGAGLGAVIGAIAGGGKGAAIGAAVGGGAGGATVLATRGKEVKLDAEQKLSFVLRKDVPVKRE